MSTRVWKYGLSTTAATQTILMPRGSTPLRFGVVDDQMFLWALVDDHAELEASYFAIIYTGHQVPDRGARYVGTAALGAYIFHLFQLTAVETPTTQLALPTATETTDGNV